MKLKLTLKDKILKPRRWIEKIKENREVFVIIIMFMLLSFIVFLSEVLDIPHHLLGAPKSPINWREALFLFILITSVGSIAIVMIRHFVIERKKAIKALAREQNLLHALMNNIADSIYFKDNKNRFVMVNKAKAEHSGVTSKNIIGKTDFDFLPKEIARQSFADDNYVMKSGRPLIDKIEKIIHLNKTEHWVSVTKVPWYDEEGKIIGTIGITRDITDRKKSEEALQQSQQKFANLFNNSPEALVYMDEKGNILDANPRFTELFGYTLEEIKGRNINDGMIHPPNKIEEGKDLDKIALSKGYFNYETIRKKKDGTLFPVAISGSNIIIDGRPKGIIGTYIDITERRKNEQLNTILYNISKAANSAITLDQLYKTIHQELGTIIDATNFYIALVDEKEDKVFFPYHQDEKDDDFPVLKLSSNNTPTTYMIRTGQPFLINRKQLNGMVAQGALTPWGTITDKSIWLGVPLKVEDKIIGAVVVQSYTNPELYHEKDIGLLEFVSSQVATAIERKRTEEKIRYLSFHDVLTGLYNRAYFEEELERYNFPRYYPLSVIMIDINGLKVINDTFGHHEGDKLLQHFASLLNSISRKGDVVARLGGDEFAILLPSTTAEQVHDFHERIKKTCEEDNIKPTYLRPSIALGCVTQKGEYQNTETLLKEADKRMYQDKDITR
ncbi:MAG TPA: PAS domain S-box protein [Candidatus Atribacteria bacterium]|nr:PAS domain S-box protein [Candidatus Atribacteria bacterium]